MAAPAKLPAVSIEPLKARRRLFPTIEPMPRCRSDLLFIWDAVDLVGQAVSPGWSGKDREVLYWPVSPVTAGTNALSIADSESRMPWKDGGEWRQDRQGRWRQLGDPRPPHDEHQREHARFLRRQTYLATVDRHQAEWEANEASLGRLKTAWDWLDSRLRDGVVQASTRFVGVQDEPDPMSPKEWLDDSFNQQFVPGKYGRWYKPASGFGQADVYIFIDRSSLDAALQVLRTPEEPQVAGVDLNALSPYLRIAIAVAIEQGVTKDVSSTVPSLTTALLAKAQDFGLSVGKLQTDDISETWAYEIAKALRWPEARRK